MKLTAKPALRKSSNHVEFATALSQQFKGQLAEKLGAIMTTAHAIRFTLNPELETLTG